MEVKFRKTRSDLGKKRGCYCNHKGYVSPHIRSEHERVLQSGDVIFIKETQIRKDLLKEIL